MKRNLVAIAVLIVLGAIALWLFRERPPADRGELDRAVRTLAADRINALRIVRREGQGTEAKTEQILLQKADGIWKMAEPVAYPVSAAPVERMLDALKALKAVDVISQNRSRHAQFQVDDSGGVAVTALDGNQQLIGIVVGKGSGSMTFMRLAGSDQVSRVIGSHRYTFDKSARSLRDKTILKLDAEAVSRVTLVQGGKTLVLARQGEGKDAKIGPVGIEIKNFDESKARLIWSAIANLNASDFADQAPPVEATGLSEEADRVTLETAGETPETITLLLGREVEKDKLVYVKNSKQDQIFLVPKYTVDRFRVQAADFQRTDKQVQEEEERRRKAEAEGAGGITTVPGAKTLPPQLMEKLKQQLANPQPAK